MDILVIFLVWSLGIGTGIFIYQIYLGRRKLTGGQKIDAFVNEMLPQLGWHDLLSGVINRVLDRSPAVQQHAISNYLRRKWQGVEAILQDARGRGGN